MNDDSYKWHVEQANDDDGEPTDAYYICHEDTECEDTTICKIENFAIEQNEVIANLLAAAPEMLEALELKMNPLTNDQNAHDKALQAIAKAKGN